MRGIVGPSWGILLVFVGALSAEQPSIFELPRIQATFSMQLATANQLLLQQKYAEAEQLLREARKTIPFDRTAAYNLACVLTRQNKLDEAMLMLADAVKFGFQDVKRLKSDADLSALREREDFQKLIQQAANTLPDPNLGWKYKVEPVEIQQGIAYVSELNTAFDQKTGLLIPQFKFTSPAAEEVVKGYGEYGKWIRKWYAEGTAAGNHGDLYDNHDNDHSNMAYGNFPQLTRVEYDDTVKKFGLHHGFQGHFFFNAPTIGNSSTALTQGPFWRCQIRYALTQPRGIEILALQYENNMLYFYPEHRDHDPGLNGPNEGFGDLLPANAPYWLLSQGSSGSDQDLMQAVALTLASFRPEVKAEFIKRRTLMPMVQMLFRSCYKPVQTTEDYLTGKAHPSAFEGKLLDLPRLVLSAHEITRELLPPLVRIKMIEEDKPVLGVDYCDIALRERICDTPSAIARIIKGKQYERRFVISAEESSDPQQEPLRYHFVLLRGDPNLVSIQPKNAAGNVVEIRVKYHERRPVEPDSKLESNRVDIGIFTNNSKYYSPPAFLSLNYLNNQKREYDAHGKILAIDYADPVVSKNYSDPQLDFTKDWRDEYQYQGEQLLGWIRKRGTEQERFTFDGCLVTKTDAQDRPVEAKVVRYQARQQPNQAGVLEQIVTNELVQYEYTGDSRVGRRK